MVFLFIKLLNYNTPREPNGSFVSYNLIKYSSYSAKGNCHIVNTKKGKENLFLHFPHTFFYFICFIVIFDDVKLFNNIKTNRYEEKRIYFVGLNVSFD